MKEYNCVNTSVSIGHLLHVVGPALRGVAGLDAVRLLVGKDMMLTRCRQCLMFAGFSCIGLHWIPTIFQRADIRKKYGLQGNFVTDLLSSCCCACCSLVQQEKEAEYREALIKEKADEAGYQKTKPMSY